MQDFLSIIARRTATFKAKAGTGCRLQATGCRKKKRSEHRTLNAEHRTPNEEETFNRQLSTFNESNTLNSSVDTGQPLPLVVDRWLLIVDRSSSLDVRCYLRRHLPLPCSLSPVACCLLEPRAIALLFL